MINPHLYQPLVKRIEPQRYGGMKYYQPIVALFTKRTFKRASEAKEYAEKVRARWCRLYDTSIRSADAAADMIAPPREAS